MSRKKPKREFSPNAHASIYLLALLYVGYQLFQLIKNAVNGGANAPSTLNLVLGIVVLGGGVILLAFLIWRMTHLPASDNVSSNSSGNASNSSSDTPDTPSASGSDAQPADAQALTETVSGDFSQNTDTPDES